jgi:LacI family transcriptional regulator
MPMKAKYYSTSDLAKKTGTSRQVISAIINENWKEKRISQATYDRITKQMHEIGFVPNRTAISLKKNKKDRIGILCHGPLYSHTSIALEKLNHYFLSSQKSVEIHMSNQGELCNAVKEMMGHRVNRIIIILSPMLPNFGEEDLREKSLTPFLSAVPHFFYNFPFDVHSPDMAQTLLKCGGHLIGFSRPDAYVPFIKRLLTKRQGRLLMDEKIHSFIKKYSKTQKLLSKLKQVVTYPNPQGGKLRENPFLLGRKLAQNLLPQIKDSNFDYLVTFSDGIAQGVAQYLDEQNISIPDELQILGFDKIDSIEFLKFPTSTIEVPVNEMIEKLITLIEKPPGRNFEHLCMTKLHLF